MSEDSNITCSCIEITQPIGTFYMAVIDARDLVHISWADVRRIEQDERDIEVISGIQRPLSPKRVEELQSYVNTVDASFPTGVILAVSSEDVSFNADRNQLDIRRDTHVAKVIDGQHRIEGLRRFDSTKGQFQVNVVIFVDMDMENQAILFSTINLKQTAVNKSLVYDLFELINGRSPQKTCHNIARVLNKRPGGPFEGRIMVLGTATGNKRETLTQSAFIEPLLKLISRDPMSDRDALKRGKSIPTIDDAEIRTKNLIFRNDFIKEKDAEIAKALITYFSAVQERWPLAWSFKIPGLILNRTTGYRALMRFLPLVYLSRQEISFNKEIVLDTLKRVKLDDENFTPERFKPGTSGESALYHQLMDDTGVDESSKWRQQKLNF